MTFSLIIRCPAALIDLPASRRGFQMPRRPLPPRSSVAMDAGRGGARASASVAVAGPEAGEAGTEAQVGGTERAVVGAASDGPHHTDIIPAIYIFCCR